MPLYHPILFLLLSFLTIRAQIFDFEVQECDLACQNGGKCYSFDGNKDGVLDPTCVCPANFTGNLCDEPAPCAYNCVNGGICIHRDNWWLDEEFYVKDIIHKCLNQGSFETCQIFNNNTYCQCPPNTYGQFCETKCDLNCENNGKCDFEGRDNVQRCICSGTHYGELCEKNCDLNCLNGGMCVTFDTNNDTIKEKRCICPSNFTGDLCGEPRACEKTCESGGTCMVRDSSRWLEDPAYFREFFAKITYDCLHKKDDGGAAENNIEDCIDTLTEEYCICPPDTFGESCELTCDPSCGANGRCQIWDDGPRCQCKGGYLGESCQAKCDLNCNNGGRCVTYDADGDSVNEKHCLCPANFTGALCNEPRICAEPCLNGGICHIREPWWFFEQVEDIGPIIDRISAQCDRDNIFSTFEEDCLGLGGNEWCECPPETYGKYCEVACDLDCQNFGNCTLSGYKNEREKKCRCRPSWSGDLCQYPCNKSCSGNGRCVANATGEFCQCAPMWEGEDCGEKRQCNKICTNGGECVLDSHHYYDEEHYFEWCHGGKNRDCPEFDLLERCTCTPEWFGSDCSKTCPCQNGGNCTRYQRVQRSNWTTSLNATPPPTPFSSFGEDVLGYDYYCYCPFGYWGKKCEFLLGDKENCQLECENGGYCQRRQSGGGWYQNDPTHPPTQTPSSDDIEYCVCPGGFTGPTCGEFFDECYNLCQNEGICSAGETSVQRGSHRALEGWQDLGEDYSCKCQDRFSGEYCERETCGSGYCANGGACIELPSGEKTNWGDDYVCDCNLDSVGTAHNSDIKFIGRQCEAPVYNECFHDVKIPNEPFACAFYGNCFYGNAGPECKCERSFEGSRCETNSSSSPVDIAWSICNLSCHHEGTCLKGVVKPIAEMFHPFLETTKKSKLFNYAPTPNYEYCYCKEGFFGVDCWKEYELCGDGEHICFHGSACEQNDRGWACDCTGTQGAGLYCQYEATDDCGDDDPETFCTNGGTCNLGSGPICDCAEGWEGTKCETEVKLATPAGDEDNNKWSSASVARILVPIMSVALMSLCLVTAY